MEDGMSITQLPLTLIVAATTRNGIGVNGGLPWPMLKKDMAYFARVTKRVPVPTGTGSVQSDALKRSLLERASRNVVIMGRKTWESIPHKFRPLKDRTNIVISTQERSKLAPIPDDVLVASDILSGLQSLESLIGSSRSMPTSRVFVIGGSSIYNAALELPQTERILLTKISKDYQCDTYFPVALEGPEGSSTSEWRRAAHRVLSEFVGEDVEEGLVSQDVDDEEVNLEFQLWERI